MASPLDVLRDDFQQIYSALDQSTTSVQKEYRFGDNRTTVIFVRVWIGESEVCGKDVTGSITVKMEYRDPALEEKMKNLFLSQVVHTWDVQSIPIIEKISFN